MCVSLAYAPAQAQERVLESYPSGDIGSTYRLVVGEPCDERMCTARLVWLADGRALDSVDLEWGFLTGHEPKRDDTGCWFTRMEGVHLETCFSLFRLDEGRHGVMVAQTAGWDHVKKSQELYAAVGDSLARIWEQGSSRGRTSKSAWVADTDGDGIDEIVARTEQEWWMPDASDAWYLETLGWDPAGGAMVRITDPQRVHPAYAAIVGSFETLAEARQRREALNRITRPDGRAGSCLPGFLVLESKYYDRLRPGWFIVAYMTADEGRAVEVLERAESCNPAIDGYVKRAE